MSFEAEEFQVWLNTFINDVSKLSMEQMEEFCTTLLNKCTIEQKCFIERCLHGLMSYDFITGLPEIPVNCILHYLEPETLLKCRQVCRTWNSIITNMSQLWWQLCLKKGGRLEAFHKERGADYFHMYMQLVRVLEKMEYEEKGFVKESLSYPDPDEDLQVIRYQDGMLAFGTSLRRVVLVDADTFGDNHESIWSGTSPSYLAISKDFIVIGTYFGEIKLWSPQNPAFHLRELTSHVNMVTCITVHPSQEYILTSSVDGNLRLHHTGDGSGWRVLLRLPDTSLSDVMYVHFLPDPSPVALQMVFGTSRYAGLAVISKEGAVLEQTCMGPVFRYLSFASAKSDPTLFYLTSYEGHEQRPGPCLIKRFRISGNTFCDEKVVHYSHTYRLDYRILAAGKRFLLLINYEGNFILLDVVRPAFVSQFKCRPTPLPMLSLPSLLKKSCFGDMECLDGLCPHSMQAGKTVLLTAGESCILSWKWNADLWGDVTWHGGDVVLH